MDTDRQDLPGNDVSPFTRLRHEREDADRVYNEALTGLDRAIQQVRTLPAPPPGFDESQLTALNDRWQLLPHAPTAGGGWLRRVRTHVWAMVGPLFERQQNFNATLVDHLNRNAAMQRESVAALGSLLTVCRQELDRLVAFESKLVQYAQTITAYVDTKDRCVEALPNTLEAATHAFGNEMQLRWESMLARDRRLTSEVEEIRTTLGVAHRAIQTLKRELEQRSAPAVSSSGDSAPAQPATPLDSYKYVGFEDQFRGGHTEIRERMTSYVDHFESCRDVLDIGCGRGEFLDLLREHGISARGVDLNDEMVAICQARGLDATRADALGYLVAQRDESLGGLFGAQIVEHLEPDYLVRLLETAYRKLRPGSVLVLETVNVACWFAFFSSYIRDITHVRPLHPDTLKYLTLASGFQRAEIRYAAPFPEPSKLQLLPVADGTTAPEAVAVANENMEKLNNLLFTNLDYAIIAHRS
jgi:SAM-dependent methyltransferase